MFRVMLVMVMMPMMGMGCKGGARAKEQHPHDQKSGGQFVHKKIPMQRSC